MLYSSAAGTRGIELIKTLCIHSCFFWSPEFKLGRGSCELSLNWEDFTKFYKLIILVYEQSPQEFSAGFQFSKAVLSLLSQRFPSFMMRPKGSKAESGLLASAL